MRGAHAAITASHRHKNIKITSNKWAIPSFKVFSFKFLKVLFSKMESYANVVKNVHNGKKNSSAINALSRDGAARDDDQETPATENASGLTYHSSASGGNRREELPFITVSRSRRRVRVPKKDPEDPVVFPLPLATEQEWRDPFGLADVPDHVDPVLCRRIPAARTKQSARKSTASSKVASPENAHSDQIPPPEPSSGSSSDRSRARLWKKGCVLDKAAADKAKKTKSKSAQEAEKEQTEGSTGADPSDGTTSDTSRTSVGDSFPVQSDQKTAVTLPRTGRFNGRIHATPLDGSCGPAALLEALRHLALTQGYQFNLPADADDMRRALVADITENVDLAGLTPESYTLGQEIAAEYFPDDQLLEEDRPGIFCPDLDERHFTLVESVQEYLSVMSMRRTHIDEFMLSAFARMWNIRVAVIRPHGKGATTEHSQFVAPNELIPAERTIFLYRSGQHFEWAHANATPCQDSLCRTHNRRISASHTPVCVPRDQSQAQPAMQRNVHAATTAAPVGSRPSRGGESDLAVLVEQLTEEFPGLSPERAEAALKLTKQNGRYNLYAAAAVLPGREGAPIVLGSPSLSRSSGERSEQDATSSVYFADDANATNTGSESSSNGSGRKRRGSGQSSGDENTAANTRAPSHERSSPLQDSATQQKDAPERDHIQRSRELQQIALRQEAERSALEERRAIMMAAQIISIAADKRLAEALDMLQRHLITCGDLQVASQLACEELMNGPRKARPLAKVNDVPDSGGISLAERRFGDGARTPTVQALAKRSRTESTDSPPQPKRLFDKAFNAQMQDVGGNLTAAQRLATAVRRADNSLWQQALDQRFSALGNDVQEGDAPEGAPLLGSQTTRTTTAEGALTPASTRALRTAASHASPGVRIAEQMRLKRELAASAPQGQGTVVVVSSNGNKLPTWKPGAEADGRGFNWKTKQKMIHAWEQYQLSEGLHAPKTFKSMIDADLVPLICAECNLEEGDWEVLDDVVLLSAIEERLRPHDSMDFTVQLKRITFNNDAAAGTLTQRYRLFAEAFLAKVSEAKAAGCALQENVIKIAFTRAVSTCAILQGWLEQQKWVSASETHRRITNHLKMVDAYETLAGMGNSYHAQQTRTTSVQQQGSSVQQQQQHQQQHVSQHQQHPHQPRSAVRQQHQQHQFNQQISSAVNAALVAYQQAGLQRRATAPIPSRNAVDGASVNAMSTQTQMSLPPFPGLDGRGLSWHICSPLLECRCSPCTGKFCQACGVHGHTVENCRKRLFKNPGANLSGYWSEQQAGRGPMRMPAPIQGTPNFVPAPVQDAPNFPPAAQRQPAFPTPYRMATGGATAQHAATQQPVQQHASSATVNNTALRNGNRVTFQEQQQHSPADSTLEGQQQQ